MTFASSATARLPVWPVWSGSTQAPKAWRRMNRKAASRLFHRARQLDRRTKMAGRHGGQIGHAALQVLHALIFDFFNFASGRLDPSYEAIAAKSNLARSTVAEALKTLARLGIISWQRRCTPTTDDLGRFQLQQETNAYTIHEEHEWKGLGAQPERAPVPAPSPDMLGFPPTAQSRVDLAGAWSTASPNASPEDLEAKARVLELDRDDMLARSRARFLRKWAEERRAKSSSDPLQAVIRRLGLFISKRPS
jgi:hypothetical protein